MVGTLTLCPPYGREVSIQISNSRCASAFSRHDLPELCVSLSLKRGSRECRMRAAPAVSCANMCEENAHEHTGSAEAIRHSLRNGFTAYFALSPENRALLSPSSANSWLIRARSGRLAFRRLERQPLRRQDHTTSPYAS